MKLRLERIVAFHTEKSKSCELLRKMYLLLGGIAVKQDDKYEHYLKSLENAKLNSRIYVELVIV